MTDQVQNPAPSTTPAETATPAAPAASLEQIASEFTVDDHAANFSARPQPSAPPQPSYQPPPQSVAPIIPDPITDQDGYRRYMTQQALVQGELHGTLRTMQQRIEVFERRDQEAEVRADIKQAVSKVNEKLKVDPMMAEVALEVMYREDVNFQRIWDNRHKNPAAYQRALGVVADKLAPKFAVRQDPQLTENQRAAQTSQRTMASTAKQDYDPRMKGLYEPESQGEFEQAWEAFKHGMTPS